MDPTAVVAASSSLCCGVAIGYVIRKAGETLGRAPQHRERKCSPDEALGSKGASSFGVRRSREPRAALSIPQLDMNPAELPTDLPSPPRMQRRISSPRLSDRGFAIVELDEARKVFGLGEYCNVNRIILCMVGLPARGKSYISKMLTRYLQWMGFPVRNFNAGELRRKEGLAGMSADFFKAMDGEAQAVRERLATATMQEAFKWLRSQDKVCVAIFDATNTTAKRRQMIADACEAGIVPVFIESICDDPAILEHNYRLKLGNDDYRGKDPVQARADFLARVDAYNSRYETVTDAELGGRIRYVKLFNVGKKVVMHNCSGYVMSNIGFYLSNIHVAPRRIFLVRCGETDDDVKGILGTITNKMTDRGVRDSRRAAKAVYDSLQALKAEVGADKVENPEAIVLTGTAPVHRATVELVVGNNPDLAPEVAQAVKNYPVVATALLNELDGGDLNGMSYTQIQQEYPDLWEEREQDKLNFRYPGAGGESYVDVIHRLEPVIIELERQRHSLVIISHLAVQRCIYAYFMNTPMEEMPQLKMDKDTVHELRISPHGTHVHEHFLGG